jgi:hypothetical protein
MATVMADDSLSDKSDFNDENQNDVTLFDMSDDFLRDDVKRDVKRDVTCDVTDSLPRRRRLTSNKTLIDESSDDDIPSHSGQG